MTLPTGSRRPSLQDGVSQAPVKPDDQRVATGPGAVGQGDAPRTGALGPHAVSQLPAAGGLPKPEAGLPDPDSKSFSARKAQLPSPAGLPPPALKARDLAVLMSDMTAIHKVVGQHKEAVARQKLEAIFDGAIARLRERQGSSFSAPAVVAALFTQVEAQRAGAREAGAKPWSWDEAVTVYRAAIAGASKALGAAAGPQLLPLVWVRDGNPNAAGQALFLELSKGGGTAVPLLAQGLAALAGRTQDLSGEYLSEAAASLVQGFAAVVPRPDGKTGGVSLAVRHGHQAAVMGLLEAAKSLEPARLERLSLGLAKGWERAKSGEAYTDMLLGSVLTDSALEKLDAAVVCAIVRGWRDGLLTPRLASADTSAQILTARQTVRQRLQDALDHSTVLYAAPYADLQRQLQVLADQLKPPLAGGVSSSSSSSSADPMR